MLGIKETKEILEGMGEATVSMKKLKTVFMKAKDNGFGIEDLIYISEAMDAMPDMDIINSAVKDADKAIDELKDLEQAEVVELIGAIYKQAEKINKA